MNAQSFYTVSEGSWLGQFAEIQVTGMLRPQAEVPQVKAVSSYRKGSTAKDRSHVDYGNVYTQAVADTAADTAMCSVAKGFLTTRHISLQHIGNG